MSQTKLFIPRGAGLDKAIDVLARHVTGTTRKITAVEVYPTLKAFDSPEWISALPPSVHQICEQAELVGGVVDGVYHDGKLDQGILFKFHHQASIVDFKSFHLPASGFDAISAGKSVGRWPRDSEYPSIDDDDSSSWNPDIMQRIRSHATPPLSPDVAPKMPSGPFAQVRITTDASVSNRNLTRASRMFPRTPIVGLCAAWTPFLNGMPVTLFHNADIHEGGSVGLCIPFDTPSSHSESVNVSATTLHGLQYLTDVPQKISKCQGNIIMDIEGKAPTSILQQLVSAHGLGKQSIFAVVSPSGSVGDDEALVSCVVGGDPAHGFISLEQFVDLPQDATMTIRFAISALSDGLDIQIDDSRDFVATIEEDQNITSNADAGLISHTGIVSQLPNFQTYITRYPGASRIL